jgi:hypothetical protein
MKLIIKLLVIVGLGIVALLVAGYFLIPPAADKAVDEGSRYAFGVPATIGKITAAPGVSATKLGFEDYVLQGPTGFTESLLSIGTFSLGVGTKSIIGDTKEVGEFVLSDVNLNLIQDGTQNNLLPVLRHLQGLGSGGAGETETADGPREGGAGPNLSIGSIRVENVGATISFKGVPGFDAVEKTFTIPSYTKDWSEITKGGKSVAEIASLVVTDLKDQALAAGEGHVPAPVLTMINTTLEGGLEGGLQGGIDAAKGLVNDEVDAAKGKASEMIEGAEDKATKAVDGAIGTAEKKAKELIGDKGGDLLKGVSGGAADTAKKAADEAKKGLKGLLGGGN